MRITQCHVSKSVSDFPFNEIYSLDDYYSVDWDCVFFGMYRFEDSALLKQHKAKKIVFWTGQDVLQWPKGHEVFSHVNVTAHVKVKALLREYGYECTYVKPAAFLNEVKPQWLGKKIYAYCPNSAPEYHGKKVLDELRCAGYEITIGDGQWSQRQWRNEKADYFYNEVGVGLCLSEFAGGGTSIIEMGLRGIPVVTNVFDLPNCTFWQNAEDVAYIIDKLQKRNGEKNTKLAQDVWNALDHKFEWLEI